MNAPMKQTLTMRILEDLDKSGLTRDDLSILDMDDTVASAIGMPATTIGYAIQYHNIHGKRLSYYRVRILDAKEGEAKYRQIKATKNHIYFPKDFMGCYLATGKKFIVFTEGEKKAAALNRFGIPAVAASGVDNWKNATVLIPKNVESQVYPHNKAMMMFKISPEALQEHAGGFAEGFEDLSDLVLKNDTQIIIVFDAPTPEANTGVQRAAAKLGYEFRNRGVPSTSIRQAYLPPVAGEKTGCDDFLVHPDGGIEKFKAVLNEVLQRSSAFPVYPNIKEYLGKVLSKPRITRKMYQEVSLALVTDLDRRGKRMYSPDEGQLYYFDQKTKHLMKVQINEGMQAAINETEFGRLLYKEYDVSPIADTKVISWLGAQIAGEAPIEDVNPSRIIARPRGNEDCVRFQLNNGQFVKVTADPNKPFEILENGEDSTLFAIEGLLPIDDDSLKKCLKEVMGKPLEPWWFDVLKDVKLKERGYAAMAMGLLYYVSPWLYRWRGTQLPIEMVCGESGSGKSTLVSLRLNILTGQASLKNAPTDLKDWYATITKSGGMHVIDNLHFTDKQLAQRMSDELAQPLDAKVLTLNGYSTIGETVVGDTIVDPWGRKVKVLKEHPHGTKPVYRVTLSDGSSTESTLDHKWLVQTRDDLKKRKIWAGQVLSLEQIVKQGLRYNGKNARNKWIIPSVVSDIDLTNPELDYSCYDMINPYVIGCLLGDGNLNNKQIWFANGDQDIVDRFESELPDGVELNSCAPYSYYLRGFRIGEFKKHLDNLGLREVLARTKFIPKQFLLASASERLELLRGLMDTDGTVRASNTGTALYSTISDQLAIDVQFIVQSLGGRSNIYKRGDGAYQVSVSLPENVNPFYCKRKAETYEKFNVRHKIGWRSIVAVDYVGEKEVKCISVDTKEGLYVTDNFITTHNCRLVTEPNPTIEQRKYFTNVDVIKFPINAIFSFTAIKQPFNNADLIQRSFILELDKVSDAIDDDGNVKDYAFDGYWLQHQLDRFGGRNMWVAHHLWVLHKFFNTVQKEWDPAYRAKYRLINLEQCLKIMAKVFNMEDQGEWIPDYLATTTNKTIRSSDWTLDGLKAYGDFRRAKELEAPFTAADIVQWASAQEDFEENHLLGNARALGRYLQTAKFNIATIAGIVEATKQGNKQFYNVTKPKGSK